jgi:hypothetical protein
MTGLSLMLYLIPFLFAFAVLWFVQWFDKRMTKKIEQECNVLYGDTIKIFFESGLPLPCYNHFQKLLRHAKQEDNFGRRNSLKDRLKRYKALNSLKEQLEVSKAWALDRISHMEEVRQECIVLFEDVLELQNVVGRPLYDAKKCKSSIMKTKDPSRMKQELESVKVILLDEADR